MRYWSMLTSADGSVDRKDLCKWVLQLTRFENIFIIISFIIAVTLYGFYA